MRNPITVQIPRAAAERLERLAGQEARRTSSRVHRELRLGAVAAIAEALRTGCRRCHGAHLVPNPAWREFWNELHAAHPTHLPETVDELRELELPAELEAQRNLFAALHGPELLPCPTCCRETVPAKRRAA